MNRPEVLRLLLQTGDRLTVTQDQQAFKPRTFTVLRGTSFSVSREIPLNVSRGETLTFVSFAVERDWALCMNDSCHQGFVPLRHIEKSSLPPQPSVRRDQPNEAMSGTSLQQLPPQPSVRRDRPNEAMSQISSQQLPPQPAVRRNWPNDAMSGISSLELSPQPSVKRGQLNEETSGMSLQQQPCPSQRSSLATGSYEDDSHSMATASAIPFNFDAHSREDASSYSSSSEEDDVEYFRVTIRHRGNAETELLEASVGHIIHVLKVNPLGMIFGECLQTSERGFISKRHLIAATPLDLEQKSHLIAASPLDLEQKSHLIAATPLDLEQKSHLIAANPQNLKPWYVGKCSRDEAEQMLCDPSQPSKIFLVRESDKEAFYVISIKDADTIRHRKISSTGGKYFAWMGHNFDTLENLVQYHITAIDGTNIGQPYNKFPPETKGRSYESATPPLPPKHISDPHKLNAQPVDLSRGLERWYIDENKIRPGVILGSGHYGEVRLATLKDTGLKVAMKTFKREEMDIEDFKNEAVAMKDLRHPFLVKLLGMSAMDNAGQTPCIIMEYHALGSLDNYCKKQGHSLLGDAQKALIAKHVASGMQYLTDCDYIHRDLAARNVLLASDLTPRIADFGLAKCMLNSNTSVLDNRMPWKWSAPEVLGDNKQWTTKCDVWSYGVLLWELYTNCQTPYESIYSKPCLLEYLKNGKRLKIPAGIRVSGVIAKVLEDCWIMRVEERTTFSRIEKVLQIIDVTTY